MSNLIALEGPPFGGKTTLGRRLQDDGYRHVPELVAYVSPLTELPAENPRWSTAAADTWYLHQEWRRWKAVCELAARQKVCADRTPLTVVTYWLTRWRLLGVSPARETVTACARALNSLDGTTVHFLVPDLDELCRRVRQHEASPDGPVERGRTGPFRWHRSKEFLSTNRESYVALRDLLCRGGHGRYPEALRGTAARSVSSGRVGALLREIPGCEEWWT
ncbi:AAA family ATPase [Kitasatospora sp. NPDC056783]|uniref:AAA family ATPase n=1 Tax=Kitasatospora sp. NPDC056783 TaxID=3345943 RepID=UPI0036CB6D62